MAGEKILGKMWQRPANSSLEGHHLLVKISSGRVLESWSISPVMLMTYRHGFVHTRCNQPILPNLKGLTWFL